MQDTKESHLKINSRNLGKQFKFYSSFGENGDDKIWVSIDGATAQALSQDGYLSKDPLITVDTSDYLEFSKKSRQWYKEHLKRLDEGLI